MIFPDFPLYDMLKKSELVELTDDEKDNLIEKIKEMDEKKHEIMYTIIKAYYIETHPCETTSDFPYGGKELKNRLKFNLDDFPSELQCMLNSFYLIE